MAAMIDLIQELYTSLQARFGTPGGSVGPGELFLAFERLGTAVSSDDFRLNAGDAAFNPAIIQQHGATLVNFVAQLDDDGFIAGRGDLSPTVTGQYDQILSGATYGGSPPSDAATGLFLDMKGNARRTFDESKASGGLAEDFWPAAFTPQLWFNDQDPTLWTSYSSSTGVSTAPPDSSPPPPRPSPPVLLRDWSWRVVTPQAAPQVQAIRTLQATPAAQRFDSEIYRTQLTTAPSVAAAPVVRPAASFLLRSQSLAAVAISSAATAPAPAASPPPRPSVMMRINPLAATTAALSSVVMTLPAEPTSSQDFRLSFDYCVASIARSWLSADFLTAASWFIPGLPAGALAHGQYENGMQRFAFLPVKLLVVKNLAISAQWSEQDRSYAQTSASLGPFSLITKTFENDTLTVPGMQIIAWFCQIAPILPSIGDPVASATPSTATPSTATPSTATG
jgi:hypothetical protein